MRSTLQDCECESAGVKAPVRPRLSSSVFNEIDRRHLFKESYEHTWKRPEWFRGFYGIPSANDSIRRNPFPALEVSLVV